MASTVNLYHSWFCPFAQRAWVALLAKGVSFEEHDIDPYNKSPEFLAINPRGMVPVIVKDGKTVYESPICIEYVDETFTGPPLLPKDPWERAQVRIWGDYISKKIVPYYYGMLLKQTTEEQNEQKTSFLKGLAELTAAMSPNGSFFTGGDFGYVDIMLVPYSLRFKVLEHYRGFKLPETIEYTRLRTWMVQCHALDCVKKTCAEEDKLVGYYKRYADNAVKSQVADAIRKGKGLP